MTPQAQGDGGKEGGIETKVTLSEGINLKFPGKSDKMNT